MAPGVMPLRLAIAGIEVLAKPRVAKRCIAERTMRSRVEVEVEIATIRCAALATAGGFRAAFALDGAFFTVSFLDVSRFHYFTGFQTCRISPLIQATRRYIERRRMGWKKRHQRRNLPRPIDSV
jgi:hypothetical protein